VIGTILAALIILAAAAILARNIADPLRVLSGVAQQIANGNLSVTIPAGDGDDELGILTRAFGQMVETLRRYTAELSQAAGQLGAAASEILAATVQVASGTAETAISINETTTTVEQMRQAAQLSAQKAQNVYESAQRVALGSQTGQKAVDETAIVMDRIREQMETIAQTVVRLSEQSQSIGGIIASVTDLADQSNLLAVNAAIEAAKAGEQGKGFAVVAQEIKSLAEQSKQATAQVRGILSEVQKATSSAVMATEQGSKAVEAGVKQGTQAGEATRVLRETSGEALQAAVQIATASQQQVVGMDQIGVAMESINQAGSQNAGSMKQMENAVKNQHELGQKLKGLVEQFKV
jgi:methyl-accepting chemotaxis protein